MTQITKSNRPRTVLSVSPDRIELNIGVDLDNARLEPFLDVIDGFLDEFSTPDKKTVFGHFSFTSDKIEISLSHKESGPEVYNSIVYRLPWKE